MVVSRNTKFFKPPRVKSKSRFYLGFVSILFAVAMFKNNEYPPYLFVTIFAVVGFLSFISSISFGDNEVETHIIH